MNNIIQDQEQRTKALNPALSFIVQAPAGSGKTELLTQRFLVLLGTVKQPEEILAITFTKKSAAEMRTRIIDALQQAATQQIVTSEHAKKTRELAERVLQQDKLFGWNLLANPSQLRIQTIDSFNSTLTKHLPILSHFGATPEIAPDPSQLYQQAIREILSHLEEDLAWSNAIATLLLHMDNDLNKVELLLVNLLAKRDQWLPYLAINSDSEQLRNKLEYSLEIIITDILKHITQYFPRTLTDEILELARYAGNNLAADQSQAPITRCCYLESLPKATINDSEYWLALSDLLLTNQHEWRKRFDKNTGFPAPTSYKNKEEKLRATEYKQRIQSLVEQLSTSDELKKYLTELRLAPNIQYDDPQWETLQALLQLLPIAVAQLKLTFQQHGKIDYIENAQAALLSLGEEDSPTDLTLALDYQIKHILIDEFQDTSNNQYRLLEKLIMGWEPYDGKTLFIVGDPMQSIYRFREAEVGLFIRARTSGIGRIKLEPLTLSVNFRSYPTVVSWVNDHFSEIFPRNDDISLSAVTYSPSIAHQISSEKKSEVKIHALLNADNKKQASSIVELIRQQKEAYPEETIAILVRSRKQLAEIIPTLKQANLLFRAIDIDPLSLRPMIQDLIALTRALLHPADRIAWLTLLRAPWCGLTLNDLFILSGNGGKKCLWEQIQNDALTSTLSEEGKHRLNRILPILKAKIAERQRTSLRYWIESSWILLGGPACIDQLSDLDDATAFFKLLEKLDNGGELSSLENLMQEVNKLFASPNHQADESLQIMTIHNSKGLEFDTVILPHLERKASNDDKQLLLWMEKIHDDNDTSLILAPVHAIGSESDPIYEYIKRQNDYKSNYENCRLLYVAATRAKRNLHIFFNLQQTNTSEISTPAPKSLLAKLWPAIKNKVSIINCAPNDTNISDKIKDTAIQNLKRLSLDWNNPIREQNLSDQLTYHQKKSGFLMPDTIAQSTGILIHQILQQMSIFGISWWQSQPSTEQDKYIQYHLKQLGILDNNLIQSVIHVKSAIQNTLSDPKGLWLLKPHVDAQSELRLTAVINQQPIQLVIDRTFIDEHGARWIIDYKSSIPPHNLLADFLDSEQKKYEKQMQQYHIAMRALDDRPIYMGLYFPRISAWKEWTF